MSDNPLAEASAESAPEPTELDVLKMRARLLGIVHSNNISVETLRAKIAEKQADTNAHVEAAQSAARIEANPLADIVAVPEKQVTIAEYLQATQMKLVRIRVTNMDPKKKDLKGEIFTVANEHLGTIRKFVPYGEQSDDGWHVPYIIYEHLRNREFQNITTTSRGAQDHVSHRMAKEFAIEVLPPLSPQELNRLASTQAAAGLFGTD